MRISWYWQFVKQRSRIGGPIERIHQPWAIVASTSNPAMVNKRDLDFLNSSCRVTSSTFKNMDPFLQLVLARKLPPPKLERPSHGGPQTQKVHESTASLQFRLTEPLPHGLFVGEIWYFCCLGKSWQNTGCARMLLAERRAGKKRLRISAKLIQGGRREALN